MLPSECLGSTNLAEQGGGDFKASRTPISATLLSLKGEKGQGSAEPSEPMWKKPRPEARQPPRAFSSPGKERKMMSAYSLRRCASKVSI